ncbi:hypothetical protein D9611_002016 [Ephemerocybe angulata]|uniref:AB hydrolase-1 domain-containing protein n=1 Tax=Ephemerocybe angulata TaxID=980116 RepID=A0A8H5CIF6_9AGAR|nr:hypothetical protein D9611_002016 [Tulosesus angulatus]
MTSANITEGYIDFNVASLSRVCTTWYKIIGDIKSSVRPLIALHGGPGVNSEYLEILSDVTTVRGGALVVYDQIGTGKSTHLQEKMGDGDFWTVQLFIDEFNNLIHNLGIEEYDLLGHSWGGMLAASIAIAEPPALKRLVLASTPASMDLWIEAQNELKSKLPKEIQDVLDKFEEDGKHTPEYQKAVAVYYGLHLCTLDPMPEPIVHGFACIEKDPTVYLTMLGPSEFNVTGSLKGWTVIDQVHKIQIRTLVTNGENDEAADTVLAPFVANIPHVKWIKFQNASHMVHFEQREKYTDAVLQFLNE